MKKLYTAPQSRILGNIKEFTVSTSGSNPPIIVEETEDGDYEGGAKMRGGVGYSEDDSFWH